MAPFTIIRKRYLASFFYFISLNYSSYAQEVVYSLNYDEPTRAGATVTNEVPVFPIDLHDYYFNSENLGLSTPQTREFVKYGNHTIDHYNGLVNMEIPLSGYKDKNFELPMSIKYISSGFIPSQRPGIVGHNWVLNFGGVIRREVKGSPDDVKGRNDESNFKNYLKKGLFVAICDGTFKQYTESNLMSFNIERSSGSNSPYLVRDIKYDMEPDIFTFVFGPHKGSFIFGNDGLPTLLSGDKQYDINVDTLAVQNYSQAGAPVFSGITITTPDGYKYAFETTEYSIPSNKHGQIMPVHITAWHLTTITAPNSRRVTFIYTQTKTSNQHQLLSYENSYSIIYRHSSLNGTDRSYSPQMKKSTNEIISEDIYYPRLQRVEIDDVDVIRFSYKEMSAFYPNDGTEGTLPLAIAAINYFSAQEDASKSEQFDYNNQVKGYYFLSSIINTDKGKYRFEYNLDKYTLPDPLTVSTDHWGFWNGDNKNAASYKSKDFCDNINDYRKVNSMGTSLAGLLYKVVYPAGGYTEITYEPNYYTGFWQRDNSKLAYNYVQTEKQLCGGARVASIKDYDHVSKQSITRIIKYKSPENTAESGIIGFTPKYNVNATEKFSQRGTKGYWVDVIEIVDGKEVVRREYKTDLYMDVITTYTTTMNSVSFNTNSTFREYFIGYSDVTEYYNDGSYVHYTYSSRKDVLDNNQDYTHRVYLPSNLISSYEGSSLSECEQAEAFNLYELNDMSRFRGILQSETTYSALGVVISKATHTYNLEDAKTQYTTCVRSVPRGMAAYKIYLQPCLLTSREKVEYATNGQIKTEYSYKYNKYNQLSEIKKINSDGSNYFVAYQYVTDIIKRTNAETELFKRNILNSLLSVVKRKDSTITDALTFQYSTSLNDTRMPLLYCILSKGIPGEKYTLETYHKYDCYGNPIYTTTKDNISSVILWSYKGLYPIVEIKNTSYEEVCNALGVTPESLLTTDKPDINRLNAIRAKLPNALITTYEHIPHVGIKTINKSGIIDYFEYDSAGRLMNVLDEKKHLVNTYNYHYTTE